MVFCCNHLPSPVFGEMVNEKSVTDTKKLDACGGTGTSHFLKKKRKESKQEAADYCVAIGNRQSPIGS
jgi:hypothetical protein